MSEAPGDSLLYKQVAGKIQQLIQSGTLRPGDRIPSVRRASEQHGVSVTTTLQAYLELENRGFIEARPKSGFFVRPQIQSRMPEPRASKPASAVRAVSVGNLQSRLFEAVRMPGIVPFGGAAPGVALLPEAKLNRILASVARSAGERGVSYDPPPGAESLRREIARRALNAGSHISRDEIVTTSGGTEALMLCLRAVTKRGDVVAVESPAYFGVLHAMEELGLKALELPMHPRDGMDLNALESLLKIHSIAACVAVPTFSNPLGALMPDENKRRLVELLTRREVPLIEDDIFGELYFGAQRPRAAQSYDKTGLVMLCSSFSKTLAPGYRVGWIVPGRYQARIQTLKLTSTLATATLPELAIAEFLANGGYDHYLRSARRTYAELVDCMRGAITSAFPPGIKITRPAGGFVLWIELPKKVDALALDDLALAQNISIAPGPMFSATQGFRNFIRISCGHPWSPRIESALGTLGTLVKKLS
ncbi:MAG: GntR family transcriptional regulator [Chthoniobacteraceae bacterium]|nr:GntR family transcriptional regulator [Chthoniobacteraceae bacterium]